MCDYDYADFEFEGCPLEVNVMMRELDQCPSLRLGHLIIKMNLEMYNLIIKCHLIHLVIKMDSQINSNDSYLLAIVVT
jgi:hypothetical protein